MTTYDGEQDLVAKAIAGDRLALEQLLLVHHRRLASHIERKIPSDCRSIVDAEDVLQMTFVEVFQRIESFDPNGPNGFSGWLTMIAEHRLLDHLKVLNAAKRGGGRRALTPHVDAEATTVVDLLGVVAINEHTPSRSVARRQAVSAIQVALAGLKDDYRQAIRLRHIEGLPVAEVAKKMNRTERAVHMLCNRGLKELKEAMGRASQFLSRK
jgi:RNA polymerase sigma-70 factor (ECF subfamily)